MNRARCVDVFARRIYSKLQERILTILPRIFFSRLYKIDRRKNVFRPGAIGKNRELGTIARTVLARNNKQPVQILTFSLRRTTTAIEKPHVFWQRNGILDDAR